MSHDVFISYASADGPLARRITAFLQDRGIRCWIDKQDLRLTGKYDDEIKHAIRRCGVLIWLGSGRSIASDYVKSEIAAASSYNRPVAPVYLELLDPKTFPEPFSLILAGLHGVQWFEGTEDVNLELLAAKLRPLVRAHRFRRSLPSAAVVALIVLAAWLGIRQILPSRSVPSDIGHQASSPVNEAPVEPQSAQPRFSRRETESAVGPEPAWATPTATPLPATVTKLPAAEVLRIAYGRAPPVEGANERPTLQMAVLARRSGQTEFSVLHDGDSLASEHDDYFLALRPLSRGYLYVFQVDSAGKKTWLFPKNETSEDSSGSNPVEAARIIQVPSEESNHVLFLDQSTGIEHIYTVFSASRWKELERALERTDGIPAKPGPEGLGASLVVTTVESRINLLNRGVAGTRPTTGKILAAFVVDRKDGDRAYSVPVSDGPQYATGAFMVVERWFRHVRSD